MIGSSAATIAAVTRVVPSVSLRRFSRRGRELGADDEQLALEPDEELAELGVRLALGPGETERGHGLVGGAVRLGAGTVLGDAAAVEEPGGAVVAGACVDLDRFGHPAILRAAT